MSERLRVAHISDTHLGYRALPNVDPDTNRNQRSVDVERALSDTITDVLEQDVDLLIHAGDVFHQSRPNWHAVRHFVTEMRRIEDAGIPSVIIAGNHDTPRYRAGGSVFSVLEVALPKTTFATGFEEEETIFPNLSLRVQSVPHGALVNPDPPVVYAIPDMRNILLTHGMAAGVLPPGAISEPGEQELDSELFDAGFDYIALGHYHISMSPLARAWYSGSTERFGWGDADAVPGYLLVEMGDSGRAGQPVHRSIPTRGLHVLDPEYADTASTGEVVDRVMRQIDGLDDPEALTRVQIRNADRHVYRDIERQLRRESVDKTLYLAVSRQAPDDSPMQLDMEQLASMKDLKSLFAEFVALRTGEQYSAEFAATFLERGSAALDEAQRIVRESETEGGGA